jgi:hypothetical protein
MPWLPQQCQAPGMESGLKKVCLFQGGSTPLCFFPGTLPAPTYREDNREKLQIDGFQGIFSLGRNQNTSEKSSGFAGIALKFAEIKPLYLYVKDNIGSSR